MLSHPLIEISKTHHIKAKNLHSREKFTTWSCERKKITELYIVHKVQIMISSLRGSERKDEAQAHADV